VLFLRCSANRFFQGFALLGFLTISISSSYGFAPGDNSSKERLIIRKTRGENENCLTTGDVDKEGNNASGKWDSKNLSPGYQFISLSFCLIAAFASLFDSPSIEWIYRDLDTSPQTLVLQLSRHILHHLHRLSFVPGMRHIHVQLDTLDLMHPTDGLEMFEPARRVQCDVKGRAYVIDRSVSYQRPRLI
jgi:hypothetical protein